MPSDREVEIKFLIDDMGSLTARLKEAGFHELTAPTHEFNTLYDQPGGKLRRRGALLRLRKFGEKWTLTYKDKSGSKTAKHKSRREIETPVEKGEAMERIIESLGYKPSFRYEKLRSEWSDSTGHVVLDKTPIGSYGEIEGPPKWIDATARLLQIAPSEYITLSYSELFLAWKRKTKCAAVDMTFAAVKTPGLKAGTKRS